MRKSDLIDRLLDSLALTCGIGEAQLAKLEDELRGEFGGDRIEYLARVGRRQIERRNRRILAELGRGRPMRAIAADLGVSLGTVAAVKEAAPCRPRHANVQRSP